MSEVEAAGRCVKFSWAGADVGKSFFEVCIHGPELLEDHRSHLKRLPVTKFPRTSEGVKEFVAWLLEKGLVGSVRVVMESTGRYSLELYEWMVQAEPSLAPAIVHPRRVKEYANGMGARSKNDQIDARVLAYYGVVHRPVAFEPIGKNYADIRELSRQRTFLVQQTTAHKQRLEEIKSDRYLARQLQDQIKLADKQVADLEKKIAKLVKQDPQLDKAHKAHDKVPGVGSVVASGVLAELGDLSRFVSNNQMVGFVGLAVKENKSGKRKGRSAISKQGNSEVRRLLHLAALACIRLDNRFSRFYHHLVNKGKTKKQAMTAMGRKILITMRALVKTGQDYLDDHRPKCAGKAVNN